jgi:hypothetical protein
MNFRALGRLACMALALSIGFEETSFAQSRREAGVGSLLEMKCYSKDTYNGIYIKNDLSLVSNRRVYKAFGFFASTQSGGVEATSENDPSEVTCDLAGRNRSPIYKNLSMTVAMNDNSIYWKDRYSTRLRLTTYLDGKYAGSTEVGFRELKRFSVDISGVRSIAFSVECFNSSDNYGKLCPVLWVLEDKLF